MAGIDFLIGEGSLLPALTYSLTNEDGSPVDLTNTLSVDFIMSDLSGAIVINEATTITDKSTGAGTYEWQGTDTQTAGMYRGRFVVNWNNGDTQLFPLPAPLNIYIEPAQTSDPLALSASAYTTPEYPYPTGYAQLQDVMSRVNPGGWDPYNPADNPTIDEVNAWLMEATAGIDAALAKRGYYVPLNPVDDYKPPAGTPLVNGIAIGAWLELRRAAASYAASYVESSRHGGTGADNDTAAQHWMASYNGLLLRLEEGIDNLYAFGVGGGFAPEIDPAKGAASGSLGAFLGGRRGRFGGKAPMFTRHMNLGSGSGLDGPEEMPTQDKVPSTGGDFDGD